MILSLYRGEWAIAYCYYFPPEPRPPGCALRVRNTSPLADRVQGFEPNAFGTYWEGSTRFNADLRLFPEIRYRGSLVHPWGWHTTSKEPLLKIFAQGLDWSKYFVKPPRNEDEFVRAVQLDGWEWDRREGGTKFVHVDELEKIEGPPPEGAF